MSAFAQFCFATLPGWGFGLVLLFGLLLTLNFRIAAFGLVTISDCTEIYHGGASLPWVAVVSVFGLLGLFVETDSGVMSLVWLQSGIVGFFRHVGEILFIPFDVAIHLWKRTCNTSSDWFEERRSDIERRRRWQQEAEEERRFDEQDRREEAARERAREEQPPPPPPRQNAYEEACAVLGLAGGFTREQLKAQYAKLVKALHSDGGGSDWLMARVNASRDVINSAHGWKK